MTHEIVPADNLQPFDDSQARKEVLRYTGIGVCNGMAVYHPPRTYFARTCMIAAFIIAFEFSAIGLAALASTGVLASSLLSISLAAAIIACVHLRSGRLTIDEQGITFPSVFLLRANGRLKRRWEELKSVTVDTHKRPERTGTLTTAVMMQFNDGSMLPVDLMRMTSDDVHSFRNALLRWSPVTHPRIPDLAATREDEQERGNDFVRREFYSINRKFAVTAYDRLSIHEDIGQYKIADVLACGQTSALYLAVTAHGTQVRLREFFLTDESEQKEELKQTLITHADALSAVKHEYICSIVDSFATAERFYYAMENKGCGSLRTALQNLEYGSNICVYAAARMAELIEAIHSSSLLHGHLHPGMFWMDNAHNIFLADFGFANNLITKASGVFQGDLNYAAPEQLSGESTIATDIYGLGKTFFYLYTRKEPRPLCPSSFTACGFNVNPMFEDLIARCTACNANERPVSAQSIAAELDMMATASGFGKSPTWARRKMFYLR